jgi:hypothetical protein
MSIKSCTKCGHDKFYQEYEVKLVRTVKIIDGEVEIISTRTDEPDYDNDIPHTTCYKCESWQ